MRAGYCIMTECGVCVCLCVSVYGLCGLLQGLLAEWHEELMSMSQRIIEVRSILRAELERIETPGAWNHIEEQIGTYA